MEDINERLQLPTDVLVLITEELQSQLLFRTCANLNETCHDVYAQTLPVLWKLVIFRNSVKNEDPGKWSRLTKSAGAEYIEFLIDIGSPVTRSLPLSQTLSRPPHSATDLPGDRCKATLSFREGMIGTEFYAYLREGYRYGGDDAVDLFTALTLLREISLPEAFVDRGPSKNHLHIIPMAEHITQSSTSLVRSDFVNVGEIDWIYQIRVDFGRGLAVQSAAVYELLLEIHRLWTASYVRTTQPSSFLLYLHTEDDLTGAVQAVSYDQAISLDRIRLLFDNLKADFIQAFLLTGKTIYIQIMARNQHSAMTCVPPANLQLQHLGTSLRLIDSFGFDENGAIINAQIGKTTYG
ncbi:hypothetical protein QFC21_005461 [Naganishia friedmannii]|uniref:Uncharacterized protein n=1 Tax=Naganishia friedmannii TaxID=89922 RepID=A0ACC2V8A7_9TREE|nr:hypothetical protein QFC21_005461 [Naganishia friedmannii]